MPVAGGPSGLAQVRSTSARPAAQERAAAKRMRRFIARLLIPSGLGGRRDPEARPESELHDSGRDADSASSKALNGIDSAIRQVENNKSGGHGKQKLCRSGRDAALVRRGT